MSFYAWGLTELTVNSCFFDTPPRAYLNYNIYILIFICVWGEPCIFGVLTVNLLTPSLFFPRLCALRGISHRYAGEEAMS